MKIQYLGGSKDSFKWDYHDYLAKGLGFEQLNILLMMTPDDNTNEGNTKPDWFPAKNEIIHFCKELREKREISLIKKLPQKTKSPYNVNLHKHKILINSKNRKQYFSGISSHKDQLFFIDPDNGMEPEKSFNEKHITYTEIANILDQISQNSAISIFQHFRRIKFTKDYQRIKERMLSIAPLVMVTGIFWHQLMFIIISKSKATITRVQELNNAYSASYPVEIPGKSR